MNVPEQMRDILLTAKTIAVVGCSPRPERPSHSIAEFLIGKGYSVVPVNPGHGKLLGRRCFPSLEAIPEDVAIDIVDVFRNSRHIATLVEPAIARRAKFFWMQEGVSDPESALRLEAAGVGVAMDRCILKEFRRLL